MALLEGGGNFKKWSSEVGEFLILEGMALKEMLKLKHNHVTLFHISALA
jgi:hypothetical protein